MAAAFTGATSAGSAEMEALAGMEALAVGMAEDDPLSA
jgi:hypothetical protein